MTKFYSNVIVSITWLLLSFLIISNNLGQMLLSILFTIFVLDFSENISKVNNQKIKKLVSLLLSILIISAVSYGMYKSIQFMWLDFNKMIDQSEELIINQLKALGFSDSINTISDAYALIFNFLKSNLSVVTFSAGLVLKVILGVILGVLFHFTSSFKVEQNSNDSWDNIMHKLTYQANVLYLSFKDIMSIQVKISIMNTIIISILALGITNIFYGQFLPYWYVIIPLTAILSLVPVVGNLILNAVILLSTIQLSPIYAGFGIGMFVLIHKLEFLVIGKQMEQKIGVALAIVLISMIIGESLFHSMSGMFLGLVLLVTLSRLLKQLEMEK